jgi:hypothetical protein
VFISWRIRWPGHVSEKFRHLYRNIAINVQFETIAVGGKIILKLFSKTGFDCVDWVHMTQGCDK